MQILSTKCQWCPGVIPYSHSIFTTEPESHSLGIQTLSRDRKKKYEHCTVSDKQSYFPGHCNFKENFELKFSFKCCQAKSK